jgi:hypothetical protein
MGIDPDQRTLGDVLARLAEAKAPEASALLASAMVSALTAQFVGPGAIRAGEVPKGALKRFAEIVANDATRRVLSAGEKSEGQRAFIGALQKAISDSLDRALAVQANHVEALGLQSGAQFLQLVNFTRRNVVEKLNALLEHTGKNAPARGGDA